MFKNTGSQKLTVLAFADAGHATLDSGDRVTGDAAQISCKVEQDDDGTQSATNDPTPDEVEDGIYTFDLTQAETNGDKLTFYPESSTAGVQVVALPSMVIYTRPPNFPDIGIESDGDVHADVKQINANTAAAENVHSYYGNLYRGTLQAGATSTTAVLNNSAAEATNDDVYVGQWLVVLTGTGQFQSRLITDYVASTRTATVWPSWDVTPALNDNSIILPAAHVNVRDLHDEVIVKANLDKNGYRLDIDEWAKFLDDRDAVASISLREFLEAVGSVLAGKTSGAGTGTETFRDLDDGRNAVVTTVDASGNRTNVAITGP